MNKEILRLAIPNILSNISIPLLSTVDTALMGRMSESHLGAVGIGAMIFNFVYWNFGFLRMGTTGMAAQAFGRKDNAEIIHIFGRAIIVALSVAALIVLLQKPFGEASFFLMNVPADQANLVSEYFYVRIYAAPASIALFAFMGWFFGMQNAIYPLLVTIILNIVNIVLSYLFVWHFDMGIAGVAWGTVIAQYVGLFLAIGLFAYKYNHLWQYHERKVVLQLDKFKQFLILNGDIFIRTFLLTFAFAFFHSQSAVLGEMVLAVNVILLQFLNWMSYAIDGFAFATESLVGKYFGAKDEKGTQKAIRYSFIWSFILALIFALSYWIFGTDLLAIFTDKAHILEAALPYLPWMILMPIIATPCYIWDGIYIGMTASVAMRNTMIMALLIFLGCYFVLVPIYGNNGLWLALTIFLGARGLVQWGWFKWKGMEMT